MIVDKVFGRFLLEFKKSVACESHTEGTDDTVDTIRHHRSRILFPYGRKSKERIISEKYTLSQPPAGLSLRCAWVYARDEENGGGGVRGETRQRARARSESIFRKSTVKPSLTAIRGSITEFVRRSIAHARYRPIPISIGTSDVENRTVNALRGKSETVCGCKLGVFVFQIFNSVLKTVLSKIIKTKIRILQ